MWLSNLDTDVVSDCECANVCRTFGPDIVRSNKKNNNDNLTTNSRKDVQKTNSWKLNASMFFISIANYFKSIFKPMVAGKRLRSQNEKRLQTARWVVKNLYTELCKDEKRLLSTNRLLPQGTLRRNCMKRIFGDWTMHAEGRCYTKKLAGLVCSKLRRKFGMEMSEVENHRMLTMLKLGRKHRVKKPKMSYMDNLDTLPLACATARPCQATM